MVNTCESNARTRPGKVQLDAMQTRRPTAVVQAEREEKQAKKAAKEAEDTAKAARHVEDTKGLRSMETRMWQNEAERAQSAVAPLMRGRGRGGTTVRGGRGGATGVRGMRGGGRGARGGHSGKAEMPSYDLPDTVDEGHSHGREDATAAVMETRSRGRGRARDNTPAEVVETRGGPIPAKGLMEFSDVGMKTWMSYYQEGIRTLDNEQWKKIIAAAKAQIALPIADPMTPAAPRKLKPLFEASART
ncbi:hypothetical protein K474DRAFT_1709212 [Panus rudis PR-1116 ss-1]|nr:hypothetical protein K474DRAFT_1709212 [Panus rudis PR-1116 ss-1]